MVFRRCFQFYDRLLLQHPIMTKAVSSAVLFGAGDEIAQRIEHYQEEGWNSDTPFTADVARRMRMAALGGFLSGPICHYWYNYLEKIVTCTGKRGVAKKIALDQFVFTPPYNWGFFVSMSMLEGETYEQACAGTMEKLPKTMVANYCFWPFVQIVSFTHIPLQHRAVFINFVCLWWSAFLSLVAAEKPQEIQHESPVLVGEIPKVEPLRSSNSTEPEQTFVRKLIQE